MKESKKVVPIKLAAVFLCVFMAICALSACKPLSTDQRIKQNISELRNIVYEGSADEIKVSFIAGKREAPFKVDGTHSGSTDFGILSVKGLSAFTGDWSYVLTSDGKSYEGSFVLHPFGISIESDLKQQLTGEISVEVKGPNNYSKQVTLEAKHTEDMISWERALDVAYTRLKSKVDAMFEDDVFKGEVYVRLVGNMTDTDNGYYYYVAFVDKEGTSTAALINPLTGDIVAIS